jgi:hypothetical protein
MPSVPVAESGMERASATWRSNSLRRELSVGAGCVEARTRLQLPLRVSDHSCPTERSAQLAGAGAEYDPTRDTRGMFFHLGSTSVSSKSASARRDDRWSGSGRFSGAI